MFSSRWSLNTYLEGWARGGDVTASYGNSWLTTNLEKLLMWWDAPHAAFNTLLWEWCGRVSRCVVVERVKSASRSGDEGGEQLSRE